LSFFIVFIFYLSRQYRNVSFIVWPSWFGNCKYLSECNKRSKWTTENGIFWTT